MTAKKSESTHSLRSRSITRTGNESISSPKATSTPASRSPGRARPAARTASPGRNLRTRSPARAGGISGGTSSSGTGTKSSSGTSPRQSRTAPSSARKSSPARPVTPTRLSARQQAVKSQRTARIVPVSSTTSGGSYPSHEDLPPTPTEEDYKTDRKLQKIVDEYLTSGGATPSGGKKKQQGKNWSKGLMTMMKNGLGVVGCVVGGVFTCTLALVFVAGPFLMSLVCDMKSCSLTTVPSTLPRNLTTYFDIEASGAVSAYLLASVLLSALPLSRLTTIITSSGLKHSHRANGLAGLVLTGAVLGAAYAYKLPVYAFISGRFLALVSTLYIYAVLLGMWMYIRGRGAPASSISPFTKSGNIVTHILSGRETNPKLLGLIDVKSFLLVHIKCLSWIVMDTVVVMEAYQRGRLNWTMILVAACHAIYLVDFILFEKYLGSTMVMTTDGVGLRLITQCLLFTPIVHTAVLRYLLLQSPTSTQWSHPALAAIAVGFVVGYVIHRVSSYQKHSYRAMPHHPGFSKLELIPSSSGRSLLCGGTLWKICRHPNHFGIIIMSIAVSLPAGFTCPLTYVYPLVIILGLIVRERRMEKLCEVRHGKGWTRYTQSTKSRLIPYIY